MDGSDSGHAFRRRLTPSRSTLQTLLGGALIAVAAANAWLGDQTTAAVALAMGVGNLLAASRLGRRVAGEDRTRRRPVISVTDDAPPEPPSRPAGGEGHRPADD